MSELDAVGRAGGLPATTTSLIQSEKSLQPTPGCCHNGFWWITRSDGSKCTGHVTAVQEH